VDALYTPILKYSKDKVTGEPDLTKAPTMRVKIPSWEGSFKVEVYDDEYQRLFPNQENPLITPMELIQKGTNVLSVIQCGGIWFANGKFGVTWKLVKVLVQKPRGTLSGQCFIQLKNTDKEKLKSSVAPVVDVVDQDDVPLRRTEEVEDSDEEQEQEQEQEQTVKAVQEEVKEEVKALAEEEPKKAVKKVIKKKVVGAEA
jgi:hypothetical protein